MVRRGVPPGHAASAEGRPGTTQAATAGTWRRQPCALAEGGGPSAAVGPRQGRLALAAPCPTSGLPMPALVGAAAPRLDPQRPRSHPPRPSTQYHVGAGGRTASRRVGQRPGYLESGPAPPKGPTPPASAPPTAHAPPLPVGSLSGRPPAWSQRSPVRPWSAPPLRPPRPSPLGGPKTRSAGLWLCRAGQPHWACSVAGAVFFFFRSQVGSFLHYTGEGEPRSQLRRRAPPPRPPQPGPAPRRAR